MPLDRQQTGSQRVVNEHTRVKADNIRCYEARVQSMIGELFARMGESHVRHDP